MSAKEGHKCDGDSCEVAPSMSSSSSSASPPAQAPPAASPRPAGPSGPPDFDISAFHKALQSLSKKIADTYQTKRRIPPKNFEDYVTRCKTHTRFASIVNTLRGLLVEIYDKNKALILRGKDSWLCDEKNPVVISVNSDIQLDITVVYAKAADEVKDTYFFTLYECLTHAGLSKSDTEELKKILKEGEESVVSTPGAKAAVAGPVGASKVGDLPKIDFPAEMAGLGGMFENLMRVVQKNVDPASKNISGDQIKNIFTELVQDPQVGGMLKQVTGAGQPSERLSQLAAPLTDRVKTPT